ncbi:glycosyltransferase family 4 protein [Leptothoe sp. ISB3NOV94-8A]
MSSDSQHRILHVLNHVRVTGNGIVNLTVDIACTQARLGHRVAIASAGGDYEALLRQENVQHFKFEQQRTLKNIPTMLGRYSELVEMFKPDIVHAHMMTGVLIAWVYRQYYKYRNWMTVNPYLLVTTVHNEFQRNAILMGLADKVIGISQAVVTAMQQRGIPKAKLQLVLNGSLGSPRQLISTAEQSSSLCKPAIVTVAGMYRRKGIVELIDAFTIVADIFVNAHLYIVGDGPDREAFEQQALKTNVSDRIHFEGFQQNPQSYMRQAEVFVLASHREPFGLVLTEAREVGCAIIASQVDGIPEAIDHGQAGILVPPKDPQALGVALSELLSNPEKIHNYRQHAQTNLERFTVERVAKETIATYEEIITKKISKPLSDSLESAM